MIGAFIVRHRALIGWLAFIAVILLSFAVVQLKLRLIRVESVLTDTQTQLKKANDALTTIRINSAKLETLNSTVNRKVTADNAITTGKIDSITVISKQNMKSPIVMNSSSVEALHDLRDAAHSKDLTWPK